MDPDEFDTVMMLTGREWEILASICWGWKRHTDQAQQNILPHYVDLCDRIINAVEPFVDNAGKEPG